MKRIPIDRCSQTAAVRAFAWIFATIAVVVGAGAAAAAGATPAAPTLVLSLYSKPAERVALRAALASAQAAALHRFRQSGLLSGYSLLFSRYADRDTWDAMEVLHFPNEAALASWRRVERRSPGGLVPAVLGLVRSLHTVVTDRVRGGGVDTAADPSILVIPYQAAVPEDEYLRYLDGYTLPQLRGWVAAGVLDGFQIEFCRFPGGRRWNALLFLDYRDDAALARRATVVAQVRARLAATNPRWKAYSDDKKSIRTERAITVAERLAAAGAGD